MFGKMGVAPCTENYTIFFLLCDQFIASSPSLSHQSRHAMSRRQAELTALKKHLGLSSGDADHTPFHSTATIGSEGRSGSPGLLLMEFFEWAEVKIMKLPEFPVPYVFGVI